MNVAWGTVLIIFTLVACWLAQALVAFSPKLGAKLGLAEAEADVDRTFFVDLRAEAIWDSFIIWTLPVAGIVLMLNNAAWAYFGLVGGGTYLYFVGRGIVVLVTMRRAGIRIGNPRMLKVYYGALGLWGLLAAVTVAMAVAALRPV